MMTLKDKVFAKLWTPKNLVREMSQNCRLNGSFYKEHGKWYIFRCFLSATNIRHTLFSALRALTNPQLKLACDCLIAK